MNAREYYYSVIAPDELGKSYQLAHQRDTYDKCPNRDAATAILNHAPHYSNDLLIEKYVKELIPLVSDPIASRLRNVFVGKRKNYFPNAGARHAQGGYDGDLIVFYVGLSDLCFQYAILFSDFLEVCDARAEYPDESQAVLRPMFKLCSNATKLATAQVDWGMGRNEIRFKGATVLTPSEGESDRAFLYATDMDKVVLYHELAHHLLGHTGFVCEEAVRLLETVKHYVPEGLSEQHQKEIEADLVALLLPISGSTKQPADAVSHCMIHGTLLLHTVLSHLKSDIFIESTSHPSWAVRSEPATKCLLDKYQCRFLDEILEDVQRFQALLYGLQDRGLGFRQRQRLDTKSRQES